MTGAEVDATLHPVVDTDAGVTAACWDDSSATLLWVAGDQVHRHNPINGTDRAVPVPQPAGAVAPRPAGGMVLTLRDGIAVVDPAGARRWLVYWARDGHGGGYTAVDRAGHLIAGTLRTDGGTGACWLTRVAPDGSLSLLRNDFSTGGGVCTSPGGDLVYAADAGRIEVFDGSGWQVLCTPGGWIGGLCTDAGGRVWAARTDADLVTCYAPGGDPVRDLVVPGPTSCCFGGTGLTELYVTGSTGIQVTTGAGTGWATPVFTG